MNDMSTPKKPAFGSPCNGCGVCCMAVQCPVSLMLFGPHDLCPALTSMGNVYACGLMCDTGRFFNHTGTDERDATLTQAVKYLLGSGIGCDAQNEDEVVPEGIREDMQNALHPAVGRAALQVIALSMRFLKV